MSTASIWAPRGLTAWSELAAGLLLLGVCLLPGSSPPQQAWLAYLTAFLFFTGLSVGSIAWLMIHPLTGGAWGVYLRPHLLAAARTLPLQAILGLPILFRIRILYPWARPELLAHDPLLRAQSWYLQPTFFVLRTLGYFLLWLVLLGLLSPVRARAAELKGALPRIAAAGLIAYALSTLFAATDWAMSLVPHWHSSTFGLMVASGWLLAAFALAVLASIRARPPAAQLARVLPDLGNLILLLILVWSYLAFMQYLTIWIADLPVETQWYVPRTLTSWRRLAWFLIIFNFALPFVILLSRYAKRRSAWLHMVTVLLLIGGLADSFWLIVPSFRPAGFALHWTDFGAALGMGALWLVAYQRRKTDDDAHG